MKKKQKSNFMFYFYDMKMQEIEKWFLDMMFFQSWSIFELIYSSFY